MTREEIDVFLDSVESEPLSEDQIEKIVASVVSSSIPHWKPEPDLSWLDTTLNYSDVEEEVYQLNRNKGQEDEETLRRIEELRRKALNKNEEDMDGLAGGTESTGEGG